MFDLYLYIYTCKATGMLSPRLSKVDIHLLHVFAVVTEAGGFAAAQAVLNTSPSTISRQITDLEHRLRLKLCQRGRAGFRLTEDGERVYAATNDLFKSLTMFRDRISTDEKTLSGILTIGILDNLNSQDQPLIVNALSTFCERAPDVELIIHTMAPDAVEIGVLSGKLDIGVGVFHTPKNGLEYSTIAAEIMDLYCGAGHPIFDCDVFAEEEKLLAESNLVGRAYLVEESVAPITSQLKIKGRAHQIEGVALLVLTGNYVGYLPVHYAEHWVRINRMRPILAGRHARPTMISAVKRNSPQANLQTQIFLDILHTHSDIEIPQMQ